MGDPRLGRIFRADPRDHDYLMARKLPETQAIGRKLWTIPTVQDQGQSPACVGYSCSNLMEGLEYAELDRATVVFDGAQLYAYANAHDGDRTPHDGSTVRAGFAALVSVGDDVTASTSSGLPIGTMHKLANYLWADMEAPGYDIDRIITWLLTIGPVVIGIDWHNDMFNPDSGGVIHPTGALAGGHAICVRGVDATDGEATFVLRNSWGAWGVTVQPDFTVVQDQGGDCLLSRADLAALFAAQGECGAPVVTVSPVVPKPLPARPTPAPTVPENSIIADIEAEFEALIAWIHAHLAKSAHQHAEALNHTRGDDVHAVLRFLISWIADVDDRVSALEDDDVDIRLTALEQAVAALAGQIAQPRHYTLSITDQEGNIMATQILDSDTAKVASVTYTDALGFPTEDPGAVAVFASSDPAIFTVDPASGAVAPVAPGVAQLQATVTNADGSVVNGSPLDVEILAGAAVGYTISVA